jgi:Uma2 family endonuclease
MTPGQQASVAWDRAETRDDAEQRILVHGVSWEQYEGLLSLFEDQAGLRLAFLEGALEIMSPSPKHEHLKTLFARLIEVYAMEKGLPLNGYGSTTFRRAAKMRGAEPDECYCLGELKDVPDFLLEVELRKGGLDKLEIYAGLGVPEVWIWRKERFLIHRLGAQGYALCERSEILPDLDVAMIASFAGATGQTQAALAFRDLLRLRG